MSENPLVSIITPSYNQARFLEATIRSVLEQDYPHIEHIVIDGASTDGSVDLLRQYDDDLAYWVSEPDDGQVDAITKGYVRSQGEILTWLNSDDVYLSPQVLSRVVSLFQRYPLADAIAGAGMILDEGGHWVRQTETFQRYAHYPQLRYRNTILQPATFFKRQVVDALPLDASLHYAFDWDFFIRLTRDFDLVVVDEAWAGYRMWGENKTAAGSAARSREQAEVIRRYLGTRSWQYVALRSLSALYRVAESLPSAVQPSLKSAIRLKSRLLSALSQRRIPVV